MQIFIVTVAINMLHAVSALRRIRQIGSYDGFVVLRLLRLFEHAGLNMLCAAYAQKKKRLLHLSNEK